jgi:hypothetical protein
MALPEGYVAIAVTVSGGEQAHPHIRRIVEGSDAITFETQLEGRNFPVRNGRRSAIFDGDYLDTLIIFYPGGPATTFTFEELPALAWTPDTDAEVRSKPPCSYYP